MQVSKPMLVVVAVLVLIAGCSSEAPGWVKDTTARFPQRIALPAPATTGPMSLEQALAQRRSRRSFSDKPLPLDTIGQLLWAGQGITGTDGKRAAPSAGALYPLELYVMTASELMHYLPDGHRVELRRQPDLRPQLQAAAFGQTTVGAAPDIIIVAANPAKTRAKYGAEAERFVYLEAGHAAENILLEATARDLAALPVGSFDAARVAALLALPPDETVLYLLPVGPRLDS